MKTRTKFVALLSAIAFFMLSLFGLGGALRAFADGGGDAAADPDQTLTSFYYFSDYEESENFYNNGFIGQCIAQNPDITRSEPYYFSSTDYDMSSFWATLMDKASDFGAISDAFVVFEVRRYMPEIIIDPTDEDGQGKVELVDNVFAFLYDTFYQLKQNNCKIMFICGMDEARFTAYSSNGHARNEFLEYVDIHINTDLQTVYHYTAITIMEETVGGEYQNWDQTTIVIDVSIGDSWDFFKKLIFYFVTTYHFSKDFTPFSPEKVLQEMGVTVFFYRPGEGYINPYPPEGDSEVDFEQKWQESLYGFVIAGIHTAENEELWNLEGACGGKAGLFPFNYGNSLVDQLLPAIMYDFIFGETGDLQQYNNWLGRCDITFKPITYSPDGWLRIPGSNVPWLNVTVDLNEMELSGFTLEDKIAFYEFLTSDPPEFAQW